MLGHYKSLQGRFKPTGKKIPGFDVVQFYKATIFKTL
jgi:hypothetical protein